MGIIYLLRDDNNKYKIGITTRKSTKRVKELQTGNAEEIRVVNEFKSKWFRKIEGSLHRRYGTKRMKGEWFELEQKDTQNFISECQSLHDTFQMLEDSGNPFI
jgi:predicted GIY-YIG superfamily endonuclease